ncbi:chemotaxis protein CheB [uncultured Limimaricola sp.]|uniref:chemotaxis protein CheB n=1 Tax=uncultured Limimaricola sp. TaxID=2211667 RepID=UPI0030FC72CA
MTTDDFLVVGLGASAGGIPALEGFFKALPADCGMAIVIVTHLNPDRRSLLHEIIGHYTELPVHVATDGQELSPDNVYVMPEGRVLTVEAGRLRLRPDDPLHRERKPIDAFFASLARDRGEAAVGIVLSGGDSDGTLGVRAIKQGGGMTLAQAHDGSNPRNPEMPDNAVASGLVDFVEPVEQMPARLAQIAQGLALPADALADSAQALRFQTEISELLRAQTGHDFAGYKNKTFMRRVTRRMKVVETTDVEAYLDLLQRNPNEAQALFQDLLINVTSFLRDPEAFEALRTQVLPALFEGRGAGDTIRLWVPGCATGEEVYSLGILLREHMDAMTQRPRVQIFATDIDEQALMVARAGRYPAALLERLSPERRRRFFRADGACEVISKEVREMCIFSPHSVTGDPPFSRMDLVSCRNLLIYMGTALQDQVIPTFHYALRPGGYLFLGTSEGVSRHAHLFGAIDKKRRIFQSRGHGSVPRRLPMAVEGTATRTRVRAEERRGLDAGGRHLRQVVEAQVLERHAPAHVAITAEGEIVFFSNNTGSYLEAPRGAPSHQILELARRELRIDLRAALRQVFESRRPATRQVLVMDRDGHDGMVVELRVEPLDVPDWSEQMYLVLFKDLTEAQPLLDQIQAAAPDDGRDAVEREMRDLRERLQSTIEEYETALEELKSSNEELVSVNEEAQSANEELEASKEEMQSLNEELTTINAELTVSVEDLDRANADLQNLYAATEIATIFLDGALVIRNYTPAASAFFSLRDTDIGRPLTELASRLHNPDLEAQVRAVFDTGTGSEYRVTTGEDDKHYLIRLAPYRDGNHAIGGVVVTIVDITNIARS